MLLNRFIMKNKKLISVFFSMLLAYGVSAAGSSTDLPNIEARLLSGEKIPCEQEGDNYCVNYQDKRFVFPVNPDKVSSRVLFKEGENFYRLELIKNPDNKTVSIIKYPHPFQYDHTQYRYHYNNYHRTPTEEEMRFYLELLKDGFIVPQKHGYHYYPDNRIIECFNGLKTMLTGQKPPVPYNFSRDPHFTNFLNFCNDHITANLIDIIPLVEEYMNHIPGLCSYIMSLRVIDILRKNPNFFEMYADKLFYVDKLYERSHEERRPGSIHGILIDQTINIERKIELLTEYHDRLYSDHGVHL